MTDSRLAVAVPPGYIVGAWRIDTHIASGSWGSVYSATRTDGSEPSQAACKFLPGNALAPAQRSVVHDLANRERLFSARVHSDLLIHTYEVLEVHDEVNAGLDGCTVIAMERAQCSLRDVLDAAEAGDAVPDAVRMLTILAEALDDVHAAGWVHGDVSPSNVLVMGDGTIRLSDFGLSAELNGTHAYVPHLGSFDYSPAEWWSEQVGDSGVEVRPSRDVWAFGIMAHQLLTSGRHPFPGADSRARALAVREYAATGSGRHLGTELSEPWRRLIGDALDPDPAARGNLATNLADRLRDISQAPIRSSAAPSASRSGSRHKRRLTLVAAATALIAASCAGVVVVGPGGDGDDGPSTGSANADGADAAGVAALAPGEIAPDSDVPDRYRGMITRSSRVCPDSVVSPAFIAALLATESGFHAKKRSPQTDEYGIAMWTPWIFQQYAPNRSKRRASVFNPSDSIQAAASYLCYLNGKLRDGPRDDPRYLAVAYRTSQDVVNKLEHVPAEYRDYVDEIERHLEEFAVPE